MPKPANNERYIQEWLNKERGDELVSYVRCVTASAAMLLPGTFIVLSATSSDPRWAAGLLGRDLKDNAVVLGSTRAFVLTQRRFYILRLSGWKERVKTLEVEVDASGVLVHYVDGVQAQGHTARYFVADLGDGRWALDSMIVTMKSGKRGPFADVADHFVQSLGSRAKQIPVSQP